MEPHFVSLYSEHVPFMVFFSPVAKRNFGGRQSSVIKLTQLNPKVSC